MQVYRWHIRSDPDAVAAEVATQILSIAQRAIVERSQFKLVLAGGGTPVKVYELLRESASDWSKWNIYLGDERCLPIGGDQRNSEVISRAWLAHSEIPDNQIHWIAAERGNIQAASDYAMTIADAFPFDLVLLGMGEDGHTASLFPGDSYPDDELVVPVSEAPKPPADRVTMNYTTLENTRQLMMLITGSGKQEALSQWQSGEELPIAKIRCQAGIDVWLDDAAATGSNFAK